MAIRPDILLQQVQSTAAWAFEDATAPHIVALGYRPPNDHYETSPEFFRMLLAAHFTSCATYAPTDVDSRIRFHAWQEAKDIEALDALMAVVDDAQKWNVRAVSACTFDVDGEMFSPHDGEFFAIKAGALARALQLQHRPLIERLSAEIEAELVRESRLFLRLARTAGREVDAMGATATLAHNGGDLTRVIEEWPIGNEEAKALRARFAKPEESTQPWGAGYRLAGKVNREVMAKENHRFMPLREPKGLRRSRDFLFAFGPVLDGVGEAVAKSKLLDTKEKAEVLAAFLAGIEEGPDHESYIRGIAGMQRYLRGGVDALEDDLPARLRKTLRKGAWRRELDVDTSRFNGRLVAKWKRAIA